MKRKFYSQTERRKGSETPGQGFCQQGKQTESLSIQLQGNKLVYQAYISNELKNAVSTDVTMNEMKSNIRQ